MKTLTPLMVLAMIACNGAEDPDAMVTLSGRVTDGQGTQARLAGPGSVSAASEVEVLATSGADAGQVVATGSVDASGSFTIDAPAELQKVVVVAIDESGERVGSVIVETTGEARGTVTTAPIDAETSLESEVFLKLTESMDAEQIDTIDLRKRIFADFAAEVRGIEEANGDADAEIDAAAHAIHAAQETRLAAFAEGGTNLDAEALWTAMLDAMTTLSSNLDDGAGAMAVYTDFFDAALDAEEDLGIDARLASAAESQASLAFRAVLESELEGRVRSESAVEAGVHGTATLEAWTTERHTLVIADSGAFDSATAAQLELAASTLVSDVRSSASVTDARLAFDAYSDTLLSSNGPIASLTIDDTLFLDVVVDTLFDVGATFEAGVFADVDGLYGPSDPEAEVVANTVVDAWADFESDLDGALAASLFTDPQIATDLMVEASVTFAID
ncbi:MAG: hypothetical protein R3F61_01840 [Myxococcota bacterium]